MTQALKEKLENFLAGAVTDGRSIAALRRKGLITEDNKLAHSGARAVGVFLNSPKFKILNPAQYAGKTVLISETHNRDYDEESSEYQSSYTNTYLISAERLMQEYAAFAVQANEYIKEKWSYEHDLMVESEYGRSARDYATWLKGYAKTRAELRAADRSYIWHILERGMTAIANGILDTQISTSNKYSIADTEDEIRDMLVDSGEVICRIDVEVCH